MNKSIQYCTTPSKRFLNVNNLICKMIFPNKKCELSILLTFNTINTKYKIKGKFTLKPLKNKLIAYVKKKNKSLNFNYLHSIKY
jgi:hypothetical protein